jgi:phosphate transport system substrate-binding protein
MLKSKETKILLTLLILSFSLSVLGYWWLNSQGLIDFNKWLVKVDQTNPIPSTNLPNNQQAKSDTIIERLTQVSSIPRGTFRYAGSSTWANIRKEVDPVIKDVLPTFLINYNSLNDQTLSTSTGIKMLLDEQVDFVQASRPISDTEQEQAKAKGYNLKSIPIAIDGIAIAVNPKLNIQKITISQLKAIYQGKINNWRELGGQDLPIVPYSRGIEEGIFDIVKTQRNNNTQFPNDVKIVRNTTIALQEIKNNLGGIYYASATEIVPQCTVKTLLVGKDDTKFVAPYQEPFVPLNNCPTNRNIVNFIAFQNGDYPLTRQLSVVVKENGQVEQQVGESYAKLLLTSQGQQLLTKAGFSSIR